MFATVIMQLQRDYHAANICYIQSKPLKQNMPEKVKTWQRRYGTLDRLRSCQPVLQNSHKQISGFDCTKMGWFWCWLMFRSMIRWFVMHFLMPYGQHHWNVNVQPIYHNYIVSWGRQTRYFCQTQNDVTARLDFGWTKFSHVLGKRRYSQPHTLRLRQIYSGYWG